MATGVYFKMNTMKNITVFGSTGMIGLPVTRELVAAGYQVTALVRNPDKAKSILPAGVILVKGDLNEPASIAEALKNADGAYINLSTRPEDKEHVFNPEMHGLNNILEAAKKAPNLKQIVYLSSFLARNYQGDWWVFRAKKSAIDRVKQSGLPYTIFYPSNFMENLLTGGMKRKNQVMYITTSVNNTAWWIAGPDFGRQVTRAFQTDKALNREYPSQGPESLTAEQAVRRLVAAYTKEKLTAGSMPLVMMKILGLFIPQMRTVSKLMQVLLNNVEPFESQQTWDELGKSETTIEVFARS